MGADHQRFLELALPHADLILAMSAVAGAAFAVGLAVLAHRGVPMLRGPAGYIAAATAGGALLYVIMVYVAAPIGTPTSCTSPRTCRSFSAISHSEP